MLAYKAVVSGDVTAASKADEKNKTRASALSSGIYTYYKDVGTDIGTVQTDVTVATGTLTAARCLAACDDDPECMAVAMTGITQGGTLACKTIKGDGNPGTFKRSMTKASFATANTFANVIG